MDEPHRRSGHVAATFKEQVFVWGGYQESGYIDAREIWIYNLKKRVWYKRLTLGEVPNATSGSCLAIANSSFYIFAGCTLHGDSNEIYELDLNSLTWSKPHVKCPKPSERNKLSCWVLGSRILYFGGYGKKPTESHIGNGRFVLDDWEFDRILGWNNDLLSYNTETSEWEALPVHESTPNPRAAHACAKLNSGTGYLFGGRYKGHRLGDLHSLNFSTWEWTAIGPQGDAPEGRSWHTLTTVDSSHIFLFGGLTTQGFTLYDAWLFDTSAEKWSKVEHERGPKMWHTASPGLYNGQIVIFGGRTDGIFVADTHSNETVTFDLHPPPLLRLALAALVKYQKETEVNWKDLPNDLWAELRYMTRGG